jgi:hypothetical protein
MIETTGGSNTVIVILEAVGPRLQFTCLFEIMMQRVSPPPRAKRAVYDRLFNCCTSLIVVT